MFQNETMNFSVVLRMASFQQQSKKRLARSFNIHQRVVLNFGRGENETALKSLWNKAFPKRKRGYYPGDFSSSLRIESSQYPKYQSVSIITISSRRDPTVSPLLATISRRKLQRPPLFCQCSFNNPSFSSAVRQKEQTPSL